VTPLEKAAEILQGIELQAATNGVTLPTLRYTQMAQPVIACAGVIVAVTATDPHPLYGPVECNASQQVTFAVSIARDCSHVANDDGTDDIVKLGQVSMTMQGDHDVLWDFAACFEEYLSKQWSVRMVITGGVAITSMTLTTGVD
jgi:hypothetical protein